MSQVTIHTAISLMEQLNKVVHPQCLKLLFTQLFTINRREAKCASHN